VIDRPLLRRFELRLPWCALATYPTPTERLPSSLLERAGRPAGVAFTKRDDLGSSVYAGNKVRALEPLLGRARARGAELLLTSGASGSNHVLATVLHGKTQGFRSRAVLFRQPAGASVDENLPVIRAGSERALLLPHWSLIPAGLALELHQQRHRSVEILPPGGASPLGALGHASAALELAEQVEAGELPAPSTVFVGLGSGGTAAGLLLGFWLAAQLRVGFVEPPRLVAVRVVPGPLASRARVVGLAERAAHLLRELSGRDDLRPPGGALGRHLVVDGSELGGGYGHATPAGRAAARLWQEERLPPLDLTYTAKVAAAFLRHRIAPGEVALFWSTKSTTPLPAL
jgi:D-cysteine desulfhydrase